MRVESRLPDASPNKSTALICAGLGEEWQAESVPFALCEAIFVDDASVDESYDILMELQKQHRWIHVLQLSRNFGQHPATVAGILHTSGD